MLTTVLFDMGGTLEDVWNNAETRANVMEKLQVVLRSHGLEPGCDAEEFDRRVWSGLKAYKAWSEPHMRELKPEEIWPDYYLRDFDFDREKVMAISEELANLWEITFYHRELRPGVREMLQELKDRGYHLGVISNNASLYNVFNVLDEYGIRDYMEDVTVSSVTGYRKPHGELFRISLRQMKAKPEECVYVGDTISRDIIGSKRAGFAKAVKIGSFLAQERDVNLPEDAEKPDVTVKEIRDLVTWLDEVNPELAPKKAKKGSSIAASFFLYTCGGLFQPAGDIGLDFLVGDAQCNGKFAVQHLLCLFHKPLIHHAQPAFLGLRLLTLGVDGQYQRQKIPAVVGADGALVVLGQRLQRGAVIGLRPDGGDQIDEFLCCFAGDHRADGYFLVVHRGVDHTVLLQGLEQIKPPVPIRPGGVGTGDLLHTADARGAVNHQISWLKHRSSPFTCCSEHKKCVLPTTGLTSVGPHAVYIVYHIFPGICKKNFLKSCKNRKAGSCEPAFRCLCLRFGILAVEHGLGAGGQTGQTLQLGGDDDLGGLAVGHFLHGL